MYVFGWNLKYFVYFINLLKFIEVLFKILDILFNSGPQYLNSFVIRVQILCFIIYLFGFYHKLLAAITIIYVLFSFILLALSRFLSMALKFINEM